MNQVDKNTHTQKYTTRQPQIEIKEGIPVGQQGLGI